jgi:hypothetical protein
MRRFLFLTLCLLGLGALVALFVLSRRRTGAGADSTVFSHDEEPAPTDRETEFSVAAPAVDLEPVMVPERHLAEEDSVEDTAVIEVVSAEESSEAEPEQPEVVSAAAGASGDPLPVEDARDEDLAAPGTSLRDDVRRELRAELEDLPRQPLFERANACGVPTSRTILMSREELIVAIEEIELRSRLTGSSA